MESSVGQRLKIFIDYLSITNKQFAATIDVSRQQLESWTNQRASLPLKVASKIVDKHKELDCRWLLTGNGNMIKEIDSSHSQDKLTEDSESFLKAIELFKKNLLIQEKYIKILESYINERKLAKIH